MINDLSLRIYNKICDTLSCGNRCGDILEFSWDLLKPFEIDALAMQDVKSHMWAPLVLIDVAHENSVGHCISCNNWYAWCCM